MSRLDELYRPDGYVENCAKSLHIEVTKPEEGRFLDNL